MGKAFSDEEKGAVRTAIMDAGFERFRTQGVRAARIEDICRDAGIAKGTFYAFFPSKEELFMSIGEAREGQHRADMLEYLDSSTGHKAVDGFFDMLMEKIETDPVLHVVRVHGELPHLLRKLPPERIGANQAGDLRFLRKVAARLKRTGAVKHASAKALEGSMTLMLALSMQRGAMSEGQYADAKKLLRSLFRAHLTRGPT